MARKEILKAVKSFHDFQVVDAVALVKPDVEPFHNGITGAFWCPGQNAGLCSEHTGRGNQPKLKGYTPYLPAGSFGAIFFWNRTILLLISSKFISSSCPPTPHKAFRKARNGFP